MRSVCNVDTLQHLPASYRHALATCRAPQVEDRLLETPSYRTMLRMSYFLPTRHLQQLWDRILVAVRQPGLQEFCGLEVFIEAKGTKLQFRSPDAPSDLLAVMKNFDHELYQVLDFSHIYGDRLYIDIGKETCPSPSGPSALDEAQGTTLTNFTMEIFQNRAKISTTSQCFVMHDIDTSRFPNPSRRHPLWSDV